MRFPLLLAAVACGLLIAGTARSVTVLRCQEADGSVTFRDKCQPGTAVLESRSIAVPPASASGAGAPKPAGQVVLYVIPDCEACDLVRLLLQKRNVPFVERNVDKNEEQQVALKSLTGSLAVPVTTIGKRLVTGYDRGQLESALQEAGFVLPVAPADKR